MAKKSFFYYVYLSFFSLFVVINIVLLSLWTINYSLFFGYSIGALVTFILFELNAISVILLLRKSKKSATILGVLKFLITIVIVFTVLIAIIFINRHYAEKNQILGIAYDKPINIIAFSLGLSNMFFAIVIALLLEKIITKKKGV